MSNKNNIPVDETLLIRYLAGEASPDEAMAVDDWLEADAANHEAFWQLQRVWEQQDAPYQAPDAAKEWTRFTAAQQKPKVRRLPMRWWMAAAVALIGMVVAYRFLTPGARQTGDMVRLLSEQGIVRDTLPDQSVVVMRPGSELGYDRAFNPRTVQMKGEGYFDIRPDGSRPFELVVEELRIRVLGTAFNIRTAPEDIVVQVSSGALRITYNNKDSVVRAGQQFHYDRVRQTCVVAAITPEQRNAYAYATQLLHFDNTTLEEVVRQVGRTYNVNITLTNPRTAGCRLSTEFYGQPLPYVLDVITASLGLSYTISGNNINISGNECK